MEKNQTNDIPPTTRSEFADGDNDGIREECQDPGPSWFATAYAEMTADGYFCEGYQIEDRWKDIEQLLVYPNRSQNECGLEAEANNGVEVGTGKDVEVKCSCAEETGYLLPCIRPDHTQVFYPDGKIFTIEQVILEDIASRELEIIRGVINSRYYGLLVMCKFIGSNEYQLVRSEHFRSYFEQELIAHYEGVLKMELRQEVEGFVSGAPKPLVAPAVQVEEIVQTDADSDDDERQSQTSETKYNIDEGVSEVDDQETVDDNHSDFVQSDNEGADSSGNQTKVEPQPSQNIPDEFDLITLSDIESEEAANWASWGHSDSESVDSEDSDAESYISETNSDELESGSEESISDDSNTDSDADSMDESESDGED